MLFPICRFSSSEVSFWQLHPFLPCTRSYSISPQPPWKQRQRERTFLLRSAPGASVPDPGLGEPGRGGWSADGLLETSPTHNRPSHHTSTTWSLNRLWRSWLPPLAAPLKSVFGELAGSPRNLPADGFYPPTAGNPALCHGRPSPRPRESSGLPG